MSKKVTIDDLAVMVKSGFDELHKEIHEVEKGMARRLEGTELKLSTDISAIHRSLSEMHSQVQDHEMRINAVEDEVVALK